MKVKSFIENPICGILLLILFSVLAYYPSLHGIWAMDDYVVNQPLGIEYIIEKMHIRKITMLTFFVNNLINPSDPFNFRLLSVIIHIGTFLLVYAFTFMTLRIYYPEEREKSHFFFNFTSLIAATLFGLHPLNSSAVSYIIQRSAVLAAFFLLLGLIAYIFSYRAQNKYLKAFLYVATVISLVFAILSKENAIMGIPLIFLYDFVFLSRYRRKAFLKKLGLFCLIGIGVVFIISPYINVLKGVSDVAKVFFAVNTPIPPTGWTATDVSWTPLEHILTAFRVVGRYLFLLFVPLPKFLVFDQWGYPISKGLFTPVTTFFSMVFIVAVLFFSILKMKKYPFLSFGILWYFIAISLESFIAVGSDLYFEHRNYLPLAGLSFGLAAQGMAFFKEKIRHTYTPFIVFIALSAILGFLTFERNAVWKDPVAFWGDSVEKTEGNARATLALANSYFAVGDFDRARLYCRKAVTVAAEKNARFYTVKSLYQYGFINFLLENEAESEKTMDLLGKLAPKTYYLQVLNGMHYYLHKNYESSIDSYSEILRGKVNILDKMIIFTLIGDAYRGKNMPGDAMKYYEKALGLNPAFPAALHGIAKIYIQRKDFALASDYLNRALRVDPYNFKVLTDLAYLTLIRGEGVDKAMPFAKRAVSLNPPFYQSYLIMATVLNASGSEERAEGYYIKAKELNAPEYLILFNRAWAYSFLGDREKQKRYLTQLLRIKDVPNDMRDKANKILAQLS